MSLAELEALVERHGYSGLTPEQLAELDAHRAGISEGQAVSVATETKLFSPAQKVPVGQNNADQFALDDDGA